MRQTVRPPVVRRRDRCWDDVPPDHSGEHLTIRSPGVLLHAAEQGSQRGEGGQ
ncbi:hypothetical protein [Ornithinimicrobium kibberense]|uniref:hypothetical protein n=1 Tax=Ornithinimicrobium kibberense TaxID=282060 RepID=UPI003618F961